MPKKIRKTKSVVTNDNKAILTRKITSTEIFGWLLIIFSLLSILTWYSVITTNIENISTQKFGPDAGNLITKMTGTSSETVIFVVFLYILYRLTTKGKIMMTVLLAWVNILFYIAEPDKLFRWVKKNET